MATKTFNVGNKHFHLSLNWEKNRYNCSRSFTARYLKNKVSCILLCFFLSYGCSAAMQGANGMVLYHEPLTHQSSLTMRANGNLDVLWLASLSPGDQEIKLNVSWGSVSYWIFFWPLKGKQSHRSPMRRGEQLRVNINIPPGSGRPALPASIRLPLLPQIYLSSNIFSSRCRSGTPPAAPTLRLW